MNPKRVLIAISVACTLPACSDEPPVFLLSSDAGADAGATDTSSSDTPTDVAGDASEDAAPDAGDDASVDAPPDTVDTPTGDEICDDGVDNDADGAIDCEDEECVDLPECAEPDPEICDDGVDNDSDGAIDCADEDCADVPECAEPDPEICDDGVDNDGDGESDCADEDCAADPSCDPVEICDDGVDNDGDGDIDCADLDCVDLPECELVCERPCEDIDGECVCPWDGSFTGSYSYITRIQIPERGTDAECCFDLDGDGDIDNGLALWLGALVALGEDIDFGDFAFDEAIRAGDITQIFEWGRGADENGFWAYEATNDLDDDGSPDTEWRDRADGRGTFRILADSLDERGAFAQFNAATHVDGWVEATAEEFDLGLRVPMGVFGGIELRLVDARFSGPISETPTGFASGEEEFDIDGELIPFGTWQLGGVVPLEVFAESLEEEAAACACAEFDLSEPILRYGDTGEYYELACAQTPGGDCTLEDGEFCGNISLLCSFLPSLPSFGLNDIDLDENGVGDALSVGLRLTAVGATLDDPPVSED